MRISNLQRKVNIKSDKIENIKYHTYNNEIMSNEQKVISNR